MFKKAFLTLAMVAGLTTVASAQGMVPVEEEPPVDPVTLVLKPYTLSIGAKAGINYSMAGEAYIHPTFDYFDFSGGVGFTAGVAANVRFGRPAGKPIGTERFGVQVEALYSMHTLSNDIENIKMNCFEIPILFQWYFLPNFAVEVGPTFKGSFSASPKNWQYNNTVYQMNKVKAYDVMLSIGLNCKLRNGFTADIRYNRGFSDIAGNIETGVSTISVGIGWLFSVIK